MDGAMDKAAIIQSLAIWTAQTNRDFLNLVREIVKNKQTAEEQVETWYSFCCSRTYSREFGDVFANPQDTANRGGDCDDLTILCLAGIHALGIPACPDVVLKTDKTTGDKQGVHVRVRCGLPPHDPPRDVANWKVLDPARESEKRWVGSTKEIYEPKMTHVVSGSFGSDRFGASELSGFAGNYGYPNTLPGALGDGTKVVSTANTDADKIETKFNEKCPIKQMLILGGIAISLLTIRAWFTVKRKNIHQELIPAFKK
jgi:hypothetical protein